MAESVLAFIRTHEAWGAPIVFVLSFGESLAFISLLLPATVILWGVGALIGASGLDFWPIWFAAAMGAALGDWFSYWLGYHYHQQIAGLWPLSRHPDLMPRAHRPWYQDGRYAPLDVVIEGWSPKVAEANYLGRLAELTGEKLEARG